MCNLPASASYYKIHRMKKIIALCFVIACTANFSFAQIKIHVEDLKPPADTLQEENYEDAITTIVRQTNRINTPKYISRFDKGTGKFVRILNPDAFRLNLIAKSKTDKPLALVTSHAFYDAMFEAYAHHRPFVLSPDMIWLLIAQGFAQHINNNAEKLRHYFVQHEGKISLIVKDDRIRLDNPNSPWEKAFSGFNNQISAYTGKDLIDVLTNNFSTTTPIIKVASQITAMESMKAYFEFVVMMIGCGIPDITLQGTPQDWEKLRTKAQYLKRYELSWWIDSLDPVLQKIVAAAKGEKDTAFWKAMFKYHEGGCGAPSYSNGWIVKFFPYNKDGHRNNLDTIYGSGMLPPETVNVPLKYVLVNDDGSAKNTDLELWAGFVGSEQNKKDFTLKPAIGWMIRRKDADDNDKNFLDKFHQQGDQVVLRVNEFPKALLQIPHIKNLELDFTDSIHIPDAVKNIQIDQLQLRGKIAEQEEKRIAALLPPTELYFNGKKYQQQ